MILVAERCMVMGKAHVFHVGSLSKYFYGSMQSAVVYHLI